MDTIKRLRIFLASPGDVQHERESVRNIVDELNQSIASPHGMTLELVRWETHTTPAFGNGPQDVVNKQIGGRDCQIRSRAVHIN